MNISLPQHPPFRFVDGLQTREKGRAIFLLRWNKADERSQFTHSPTLLLVEALAQSASAYFMTGGGEGGRGALAQIDAVVPHRTPNQQEEISCEVIHQRQFGALHQFSGTCTGENNESILSARFTVAEKAEGSA